MNPSDLLTQMKQALHARADVNGDGKLTRTDVEQVARQMVAQAEAQTSAHPAVGLTIAAVAGGFAGAAIRYLFGC